jgi:hypothetical protein
VFFHRILFRQLLCISVLSYVLVRPSGIESLWRRKRYSAPHFAMTQQFVNIILILHTTATARANYYDVMMVNSNQPAEMLEESPIDVETISYYFSPLLDGMTTDDTCKACLSFVESLKKLDMKVNTSKSPIIGIANQTSRFSYRRFWLATAKRWRVRTKDSAEDWPTRF